MFLSVGVFFFEMFNFFEDLLYLKVKDNIVYDFIFYFA